MDFIKLKYGNCEKSFYMNKNNIVGIFEDDKKVWVEHKYCVEYNRFGKAKILKNSVHVNEYQGTLEELLKEFES